MKKKLVGALLLFLPLFLWVGIAHGQSFRSGDTTTVAAGEVVDSTLYAAGNTIDIAGEVKGDVFCAGQNITVSGKVTGDVICAGQTVRVSGTVEGDVRVAGQTVAIGGEVTGNVSVAGQTVTIEGSAKIGGDASVGGDSAVVNGIVGRDLAVGGTTVLLSNKVGRNVKASTENLSLVNGAEVAGELSYTSRSDAYVASGAKVNGTTTRYEPKEEHQDDNRGTVLGFSLGVAFMIILAFMILALALVLLFPTAIHNTANLALADPLKTFVIGLSASLIAPIVIVALMISVVGIPLGILAGLVWLIILMLNGPLFGYFLGRLVWRDQRNAVVIMAVGVLILLVTYLIPFVGVVTFLAMFWMGTGMAIRQLFHSIPRPQYTVGAPAAKLRANKKGGGRA